MQREVTLPEISENVDSGSVASILVAEGDAVRVDQGLIEIETDKATAEVPSTVAGTVTEVLVAEGDEVKVGAVIMKIETEGSDADEPAEEQPEPEATEEPESEKGAEQKTGSESRRAKEAGPEKRKPESRETGDEQSPPTAGGKVPASPSTRKLAREIGVDIAGVTGSGPGNRVTADDVKRAARDSAGAARPAAAGEPRQINRQRVQLARLLPLGGDETRSTGKRAADNRRKHAGGVADDPARYSV